MKSTKIDIVGRYESIDLPELGLEGIKAKIDTGAGISSIHCSHIHVVKKDGQHVLECHLLGLKSPVFYFTEFKERLIRSSNGQSEIRYAVKIQVSINSRKIKTEFTLSKRDQMNFPVLLGRRFLRNRFIVDVSKMYLFSTFHSAKK